MYTYCHTLSLHDALPISCERIASSPARRSRSTTAGSAIAIPCTATTSTGRPAPASPPASPTAPTGLSSTFAVTRSEEHTSELQSLMRISYAVFCLKKTNLDASKQYFITHSEQQPT